MCDVARHVPDGVVVGRVVRARGVDATARCASRVRASSTRDVDRARVERGFVDDDAAVIIQRALSRV